MKKSTLFSLIAAAVVIPRRVAALGGAGVDGDLGVVAVDVLIAEPGTAVGGR